jgi:hypothetical protein
MSSNTSSSGGIGFGGVLQIVFIVMKLTNIITWSWWLVLAPMGIPIAILISLWIIYVILYVILKAIER